MITTISRLFLYLIVSVSSLVAANKPSIDDCPGIGWDFKIAPYLKAAQDLQKIGYVAASATLSGMGNDQKTRRPGIRAL